jgi:hypothetical protein
MTNNTSESTHVHHTPVLHIGVARPPRAILVLLHAGGKHEHAVSASTFARVMYSSHSANVILHCTWYMYRGAYSSCGEHVHRGKQRARHGAVCGSNLHAVNRARRLSCFSTSYAALNNMHMMSASKGCTIAIGGTRPPRCTTLYQHQACYCCCPPPGPATSIAVALAHALLSLYL